MEAVRVRLPKRLLFGELPSVKGTLKTGHWKYWVRRLGEDMEAPGIDRGGWTTVAQKPREWEAIIAL